MVAHELGHVANDDIRRGLAYVAIVAPFGLLFVRELGARDGPTPGHRPGESGGGPDLSARASPSRSSSSTFPATSSRARSRRRADKFALDLTHDPKALVELQVELARANISDPDPPGWFAALFGTHPTTVQRIGAALASERGQP